MEPSTHTENIDDQTNGKLKSQASARRARERELERKRARGEISCAECRRLKLKCNKKVPCSSCIRRGCHTICPNGLISTGQGSRFVLANTDKLHSKLLQMSRRIRQLEDALHISHSSISNEPHPLLSEELLAIKAGVDSLSNDQDVENDEAANEEEELITAMGTLTVSESGASRFVGRVGSETLLLNESIDELADHSRANTGCDSDIERRLPEQLLDAAKDFPFAQLNISKEHLIRVIMEHLPTYERATALAEAYLENTAWLPRPIKRDQIMESLLPFVYKKESSGWQSMETDGNDERDGMHKIHNLALVLALFACGAAADLTLPPSNSEGRLYNILSLSALTTHSLVAPGGASLETVQAIIIISQYDFFSGEKKTLESTWKTVSIGLIIATSIGLHRDPAHWNMESKYIHRRRHAFWEIFALDNWKSLGTGRPAVFRLQEIDCEFPEDEDATMDEKGSHREGWSRWRYRFAKEVVGPLSELFCLTRPVKYSEILDFDRKIREFEDPYIPESSGPSGNVRGRLWSIQREIALLAIHRNFFARAIVKHSDNPLRSPFAPSYLAAYACSIRLLRNSRACFDLNPGSVLRLWPVWTQCLTCGVIIGSVASKANQLPLASAAFHDLNLAISLFETASSHPVTKQGLPILLRLRDRARLSLQSRASEPGLPSGVATPKSEQGEEEELNILHGNARLVKINKKNHGSPNKLSPSQGSSSSTPRTVHASSISPPQMAGIADPALRRQDAADIMLFDSLRTAARSSDQTWPTVPSSSASIDQDIVPLWNVFYNVPSDGTNLGPTTSSLYSNPQPYGQYSQLPPRQSLHYQYNLNTENPQASVQYDSGSSSATSSNTWLPERGQLASKSPEAFSNVQAVLEAAQDVNTTSPAYDLTWLIASETGGSSEIGGDAAQFMEDWQFQAAMEGQMDARILSGFY